jgi:hypothetical protein
MIFSLGSADVDTEGEHVHDSVTLGCKRYKELDETMKPHSPSPSTSREPRTRGSLQGWRVRITLEPCAHNARPAPASCNLESPSTKVGFWSLHRQLWYHAKCINLTANWYKVMPNKLSWLQFLAECKPAPNQHEKHEPGTINVNISSAQWCMLPIYYTIYSVRILYLLAKLFSTYIAWSS